MGSYELGGDAIEPSLTGATGGATLSPEPGPQFPAYMGFGANWTASDGLGLDCLVGIETLGCSYSVASSSSWQAPVTQVFSLDSYSYRIAPDLAFSGRAFGLPQGRHAWLGLGLDGEWAFASYGGIYGGGAWAVEPYGRVVFPSGRRTANVQGIRNGPWNC